MAAMASLDCFLSGWNSTNRPARLRTRWILLHHFNADGGTLQFLPMIVDELPGLVVHLEGAHFGSSSRGRIAHFDGAGAGGKFTTISGQYLNKLKVRQVRLLHFEPSGAGRIVVVLHHDAFRIGQAAPVGNHTVVEHGWIPTGRHLFGQVNVIGVWPQFLDESGRIDMALPERQWRERSEEHTSELQSLRHL